MLNSIMCFLKGVQIGNTLIKMVQEFAWLWIYESNRVATFMIDNQLTVFWLNKRLEYFYFLCIIYYSNLDVCLSQLLFWETNLTWIIIF